MNQTNTALTLIALLVLPLSGQAEDTTEFPQGLQGFNGMLIGRLVDKDVEKGEFTVEVQLVPRVWRNNKSENPKIAIGKTLTVDGVFGKFLDVLLVCKSGETVEFEAKHNSGTRLTFPGEWLKKTAAVKAADFPEPPQAFRRFHGVVDGRVVGKRPESMELTLQVTRIGEVKPDSGAKDPQTVVGKSIMLAGFWQLREEFSQIEVGNVLRATLVHQSPQSDHFTVQAANKLKSKKSTEP